MISASSAPPVTTHLHRCAVPAGADIIRSCQLSATKGFPRSFGKLAVLLLSLVISDAYSAESINQHAIKSHLVTTSLLTDISYSQGTIAAVGERGHIITSTDNGINWRQSDVPTQTLLTGVFMLSATKGWAVGHDTTILTTKDGGNTWQTQYHAPEKEQPLMDVWFKDENHGIAIGAYGLYMNTNDGGRTWKEQAISKDDFHLNSLHAAADGKLYIAGEAGSLYRSSDNGLAWKKLRTPYQGSFFNTLSLKDGTLLVFGMRGNLYRSKNNGRKWEKIPTNTDISLFDGIQLSNETILIVSLDGRVFIGNGSGKNFLVHNIPGAKGILAIASIKNGDIIFTGESGISRISALQNLR